MATDPKLFPFYSGNPQTLAADVPALISTIERNRDREVAAYAADEGLAAAVNVALLLGQPLLLTGEPGTGKTQLAYSVGRELGYEVLKFETKSTSTARDLFYTYDTLRRFHDAQLQLSRESTEYLSFGALGAAIIRSCPRRVYDQYLPEAFQHGDARRSIVLIDEIDKASRDFPNDLLNEVEGMYFKIPEIGMSEARIAADEKLRPIIIITSNSEKSLPDAFLRRCIFYNIPFPGTERLFEIVLSHMNLPASEQPLWLDDAIEFFSLLRLPNKGLEKRPATAELLNWLAYLRETGLGDERLRGRKGLVRSSLSTLFKTVADQERASIILSEWLGESTK
jgi:MoxR-like ATPase